MDDGAPIPFEHSFTATPDTARDLAKASVRHFVTTKPFGACLLIYFVVLGLFLYLGFDDTYSVASRVIAVVLYAGVSVVLVAVLAAGGMYAMVLRNARRNVPSGTRLETGFGPDAYVTRRPDATARYAFTAVRSITPRGDFVVIQLHNGPLLTTWPRQLFPDDEVARIREASQRGT